MACKGHVGRSNMGVCWGCIQGVEIRVRKDDIFQRQFMPGSLGTMAIVYGSVASSLRLALYELFMPSWWPPQAVHSQINISDGNARATWATAACAHGVLNCDRPHVPA